MTEFISRKYGNDGYEVIIKTNSHEHYKASEDFARGLIDHAKPMTNGDRLRNMTDEELTDLLVNGRQTFRCYNCAPFECDNNCEKHCMEWLKQPAEVDNES